MKKCYIAMIPARLGSQQIPEWQAAYNVSDRQLYKLRLF